MASLRSSAIFRPPFLLLLVVVLMTCNAVECADTDSSALIGLKNSFTSNNAALASWRPGSHVCSSWTGITCDAKSSVIGIRLENMGLSGAIDVKSLLKLPWLRSISFVNNSFSGPIPPFHLLPNLKTLQISGNHFSNSIPSNFFDRMVGLKKLWLSNNNFMGKIPPSIAKLTHLSELRLENNQFSGEIPAGIDLPVLEILDLSNNKLEGQVPGNLLRFGKNSFMGNVGLCSGTLNPQICTDDGNGNNKNVNMVGGAPTGNSNVGNAGTNGNAPKKITLGMMTAGLIFGVMGVGVVLSRYKNKGNESKSDALPTAMNNSMCWSEKKIGSRGVSSIKSEGIENLVFVNKDRGVFGMLDLMRAGAEVMGHGVLGSSYKATMSNGLKVMVKRVKDMNQMDRAGFEGEMGRMGKLRHPNLLPLLAYQYRAEEKLLVSEFVAQGSLATLLNGDRDHFDWPTRLKIIQGMARGLAYLESQVQPGPPHGHLKSSNVLLGKDFEPMLVDYGFSPLMKHDQASESLCSYTSPPQAQKASSKSDVYCLGLIILDMLTQDKEQDVIDSKLVKTKNTTGEIMKLIKIGVKCTNSDPNLRLGLDEVVKMIAQIQVEGDEMIQEDNMQQQTHINILKEEHNQSELEQVPR